MALASSTVWEIRSGGSANNSGGFNIGSANFMTDLAATSATGNSPVVTSATYTFVAGDVNAWVYIKSGANWTPGWYQIASVSAGAATLKAAIGEAIQVTSGRYSTNTVAGCATTASPTAGTYGVDYSQQNSAGFALTGVTTAGAGAIFLSTSASKSMLGNLVHVVSGTNFTAGWYEVTAVTAGVSVTCDANVASGVGATGVINIGGAMASAGGVGSSSANQGVVAGNTIWLNGTFSPGGTADTINAAGSRTLPIRYVGYSSKRGDGYLGRTNANGASIVTNMPTITYTTARWTSNAAFILLDCINFVGASSGNTITISADCAVARCKVVNSSTNSGACAIGADVARALIFDCDIALTGASGGAQAVTIAGDRARLVACRITGGPAKGVSSGATSNFILNNTIYSCTGVGIQSAGTGATPSIFNNTVVGGSTDGINIITGTTGLCTIIGNMITDNGGYGINLVDANNGAVIAYNRLRDNTSGNINGGDGWLNATGWGEVTTDTGTYATDYTDFVGGDYSLIAASPGAYASLPLYSSMGALQRPASAGGSGTFPSAPSLRGNFEN